MRCPALLLYGQEDPWVKNPRIPTPTLTPTLTLTLTLTLALTLTLTLTR